MRNPFQEINPAGITLAPDGSIKYADKELSEHINALQSEVTPDGIVIYTNPQNCTNSLCTNTIDTKTVNADVCTNSICTGAQANSECGNFSKCAGGSNDPGCTNGGTCNNAGNNGCNNDNDCSELSDTGCVDGGACGVCT